MLRTKKPVNKISKTTEKIRDEEKSSKKGINGRMEYTTVRYNKDTNNILKLEEPHQTHSKVKRENSHTLKMYKMEKNKWKNKLLKDTKEKIILAHQKRGTQTINRRSV